MALPAALTVNVLAAPAPTVTGPDVPVIVEETVSVAVIVRAPAVFKVALNVPVPLVRVELAGKTPWVSVPVKWTVPE